MLLRRITEHVKAQNWFAVVIDFAIVVVGILLAFQITEWNQDRKDRILEREYLQRLVQDLDGDAQSIESSMAAAQYRAAGMGMLLDLHDDVDAAVENQCDYLFKISIAASAGFRPALNQTHSEMVTSGKLNVITSNVVKNKLGNYYNSYQDLADSMPRIIERIMPLAVMQRNHSPVTLGRAINKALRIKNLNLNNPQSFDLAKMSLCSFQSGDFRKFYTSINKDPEYYGLLQGAEAVQLYLALALERLLAANRSLRELIIEELEQQ